MTNQPDPVTGEDIRGLREDTQGLTTSIEVFATRGELNRETSRRRSGLLFIAAALAILVGGGFYVRGIANDTRQAVDEIVAQRKESRAGLCAAIDDMRERHNHFVQTAIDERFAVIAATNANPNATPQQKADSEFFFQQQIAKYRQDLLTVIDCENPDALATLFTKPGGSK
jgi:hypothetical protein